MRAAPLLLAFLAPALLTTRASGAVIQGMVLDDESGNPLARAQVNLLPLPGTPAAAVSMRNGERGAFVILNVQPGWYVLRVTRRGYAVTEAGQARAGRPGKPFQVNAEDQPTFLQIRMTRLAAVTGTILDDNAIGIPDWPVHIYSAKRPVRRVAETMTDDRGNFRIGALEAGTYVVRSGAGSLEDDTPLLPTYFKYGTRLENSEPVRAKLGQTASDVVIRPTRGRLVSVSGILNAPGDRPARLTLVTDTGRRVIASLGPPQTAVPFEASGIPPGPVELIVDGPSCGGYARLLLFNDSNGQRIGCSVLQPSAVDWRVDNTRAQFQFPILMRRADLDGVGPVKQYKPDEPIAPGHWEIMVQTGNSHYVTSVRSGSNVPPQLTDDGWFAADVSGYSRLQIFLSSHPASIVGDVVVGGRPVAGAVVYLELYNLEQQNSRIRIFSTRTSPQGQYTFEGLTPGQYRLLSSFDFDPDDPFGMDKAVGIVAREGEQALQRLEMIAP